LIERELPVVLLRDVLWRRTDEPFLEHCRLQEFRDGFILDGRTLGVVNGTPIEAHYVVHCAHDWTTRHVGASVLHGTTTRQIRLRRDEQGRWWNDDAHLPAFDGIDDVDLAITPSTNTLPIRRLALGIGESRSCTAAWVRFPELTVEPLAQYYVRLDADLYRYESRGGAFTAEIQVDDMGVVVRYGDIWERLAP
jgi:uncharacterized protein